MERMISDGLWKRIEPLLPKMKKRPGKAGRPPTPYREILEAVFFVMRTGTQWRFLPERYPPKSTVYDRFQQLVEAGFFEKLSRSLARELAEEGVLDLSECFADGTFASAKKGVQRSARREGEKARK